MSGARADASFRAKLRTPFATLGIGTDGRSVTRVAYLPPTEPELAATDDVAERAVRELERYLVDPGFRFTVPIAPKGTLLERRVWDAIAAIPAGQSRTYGELAQRLVTAARSVGQACGANRLPVIIPCHRVVGANGSLGGFMGKRAGENSADGDLFAWETTDGATGRVFPAAIKRWLLAHEGYRFGR